MMNSVSRFFHARLLCMFSIFMIISLEPRKILAIVGIGDQKTNKQTPLCNNQITSVPQGYGDISGMSCKPIWGDILALSYVQKGSVMTIVLSGKYSPRWIGIGFSKDGKMKGSSAMVGWMSEDHKRSTVNQYYLEDYSASRVIPNKGYFNLTNASPIIRRQDDLIYIAFQINSPTHLAKQPIILALGDGIPTGNSLTPHVDSKSIQFDFEKGAKTIPFQNRAANKVNHGRIVVIGWGLLFPLGAIMPRYFRQKEPLWFYLHSTIQFVTYVIVLCGVGLGRITFEQTLLKFPAKTFAASVHRAIGIFAVTIATIQILTFILRSQKENLPKFYKNWLVYHRCAGKVVMIIGIVNACIGYKLSQAPVARRLELGFCVGCFVIPAVVLEILLPQNRICKKISPETTPPVFKVPPDQQPAVLKVAPDNI